MISKDTWNNVLSIGQRRKAVVTLYPNASESIIDEYSQKITTKLNVDIRIFLSLLNSLKIVNFLKLV